MMDAYDGILPGTAKTQSDPGEKGFSKIAVLLEATGGLSLSQVCVVTGLEASTIQNWVKRGWVAHPVGKRYEEIHIARILIINALKECIKLEHIAMLITYLNGKAKNNSQAIIKESTLYNYLCEAMKRSGSMGDSSRGGVENVVDSVIKDYDNPDPHARVKLRKVLTLMMFACVCTDVKRRTEAMMGQIIKELNNQPAATAQAKKAQVSATKPEITLPQQSTPQRIVSAVPAVPDVPTAPVTHENVASASADSISSPAMPATVKPVAAATPIPVAAPLPVKPVMPPQPVTPIKITLDEPAKSDERLDEVAQTRKTISQALREWDISSVEKIIIDHDEEARSNVEAPPEVKKPVNRPWYIRKNK